MAKHEKQTVNEIEDATIVAFLALQGHKITPVKNPNGRIVFEVYGDIANDVEAFYTNQKVGIIDYVRIFKSVRGSIFTMKAMGQNKDRE